MMKLSVREKQLVFILVVLTMFALTFKFGYMNVIAKSEALALENASLYTELAKLNKFIAQEEEHKQEIKQMNEESAAIADKYGPQNTPEKTLVFFDTVEKISAMEVKDITFGETLPVGIGATDETAQVEETQSDAEANTADSMEELTPVGDIRIYCTPVTIRYSTSYAGLKNAMKVINNCPERMTIESINTAYDEGTGKLSGIFVLNMYEITGTDKVYQSPAITDIPWGKPLPFSVN